MGEPVAGEVIRKVEDKFGFALDPIIKSFYKQCNGISYRAYKVNAEVEKSLSEVGKVWNDTFIKWNEFCNEKEIDWILDDKSAILEDGAVRHLYIRPLDEVLLGKQYLIDEDYEDDANL